MSSFLLRGIVIRLLRVLKWLAAVSPDWWIA
jgi:hypothetical protein